MACRDVKLSDRRVCICSREYLILVDPHECMYFRSERALFCVYVLFCVNYMHFTLNAMAFHARMNSCSFRLCARARDVSTELLRARARANEIDFIRLSLCLMIFHAVSFG